MASDKTIKKVLLIGSGPIVIGQAAEFDYAGSQALKVLKEEGIEVVLVNSNPATIMTDQAMADKIYLEPLTERTVERIIDKEKPDSILSGFGGQTGLTICMQLAKSGFLLSRNVRLLGASPETIDKAEDRQLFKNEMLKLNQPCIPSQIANTLEEAIKEARIIGYPVVVRPAFTLGGSGGGIVDDEPALIETAKNGLALSPIHQVLIEKSVAGWKEIEFEVIRDRVGNCITVCGMENFDPVGVHTGDSIVVAPTVTLSNKEYQMLRSASISIIDALKIEGGCNCQFALNPNSMDYAVIEVNPRVSRSSALASKATGYPIAKVSAKIALGYTLDEIGNDITKRTKAGFEPALDYIVVKYPKWPFEKFVYADRRLGTQMKATGEVMAIGDSFENALMKAVRGAELKTDTISISKFKSYETEELLNAIKTATDERLFQLYELLLRGEKPETIFEITKIDKWFLYRLKNLADFENSIRDKQISEDEYLEAKKLGYTDKSIEKISGNKIKNKIYPVYKTVDTCAGEFEAYTPYFYSVFEHDDEAITFAGKNPKGTVIVIGSGPIRIGQGIEFDYASVHSVRSLKESGYDVVIINNNPETVSTDFDTATRLYFEPLTIEDVMAVIRIERPIGVVVAFGGQTAIKLVKGLADNGIRIIGSSADTVDMAEDRERFDELLTRLDIARPKGETVFTESEALKSANELGYPVLMRPSYVLGGQNMIIAYSDDDIKEYMKIIIGGGIENPILIDKYLMGVETEVDAICDGENVLIPGIMEHVERTGIHSGDSIAVYPAMHIDDETAAKIEETTRKLCFGLKAIGLINLQYIVANGKIYVIEVNPRASRTVPYLSKVTGINMCRVATLCSLGQKLKDLGYDGGIYPIPPYTTIKVPVFSFEKLSNVDTQLGPEMKSTGEVLGIGKTFNEALYKGLLSAGYKMNKNGGVFVSVRDNDKSEICEIVQKLVEIGFKIYSTKGTALTLSKAGINAEIVNKIHESKDNTTMDLLNSGLVSYVISTSQKGRNPQRDSVKIRRKATQLGIPCLTAIDTANALADSLKSNFSEFNTELFNINSLRREKIKMKITKMQGCGNDYIYIDEFNQRIEAPESLSVLLSDRHYGVGGDGVVLICPSENADAKMRMFNRDGSEGKMCGNAIRCVGKYLFDNGMTDKRDLTIETLSGIKRLHLFTTNGAVSKVTVDMGKVELQPEKIPTSLKCVALKYPMRVGRNLYTVSLLNVGNPHCVVFTSALEKVDVKTEGMAIESLNCFPEGVNVEFVKVIDKNNIKMRVYERGSGETLSCGTGACAAAVACCLANYCDENSDINVELDGGDLVVRYCDGEVYLSGGCEKIFDGEVDL